MIAKKGYITVGALVNEWLTNMAYTEHIEEDILKRWASFRAEQIIDTEQLSYTLALLDVKDFKAKLPDGLHSIYLAACVSDMSKCWNREMLVGYTQKVYGTDCDVEVNLLCPKCNSKTCSCDGAVIDVQVDDLYLQARPYLWAMNSNKYVGYSAATTDGFPCTDFSPDYKLMKPRVSNDTLWNSEYFLGICKSLGDVNCYTYEIEPPYLLTDLKEGQIYISYLRYHKDIDGYFLIPNYTVIVDAVNAYITEKMMHRQWMKDGNQSDRLRWIDAKKESDLLLYQARSEVETPSSDKWSSIMNQHWVQSRERFHYGR